MKGDAHPMIRKANILGEYRYTLERIWDKKKDMMGWVMLNPSTANAFEDDATIRRCMAFARREGFGGILVMNAYALRSRDPKALWKHPDPIGHKNDTHLATISVRCPLVVAGWGNNIKLARAEKIRTRYGENWQAFGLTKSGHPLHPLYMRSDARLHLIKDLMNGLD